MKRICWRKGELIFVKIPSIQNGIYLRNKTYDIHIFFQIFIREELSFVKNHNHLNTIIDAGANIGLSTVYLKSLFPEATILAIEPAKENFLLLQKNLNGYKNLIPVNAAVTGGKRMVSILNPSSNVASFQVGVSESLNTILSNTLEGFINDCAFEKIDLVKMDIEGSEKEVFEEIDNSVLQKVQAFAIEIHEEIQPGVTKLINAKLTAFSSNKTHGEYIFFKKINL